MPRKLVLPSVTSDKLYGAILRVLECFVFLHLLIMKLNLTSISMRVSR